jgi:nitrous oxide reductase accessory protein NosL
MRKYLVLVSVMVVLFAGCTAAVSTVAPEPAKLGATEAVSLLSALKATLTDNGTAAQNALVDEAIGLSVNTANTVGPPATAPDNKQHIAALVQSDAQEKSAPTSAAKAAARAIAAAENKAGQSNVSALAASVATAEASKSQVNVAGGINAAVTSAEGGGGWVSILLAAIGGALPVAGVAYAKHKQVGAMQDHNDSLASVVTALTAAAATVIAPPAATAPPPVATVDPLANKMAA